MYDPRPSLTKLRSSVPVATHQTDRNPVIAPSYTQCLWSIIGCLVAAESFLGRDRVWHCTNDTQRAFVEHHFIPNRGIKLDGVESMASGDANEVMAWLAAHGVTANIPAYERTETEVEFGIASVLDVFLRWRVGTAKRTVITVRNNRFDAVTIDLKVTFYQAGYEEPVVEILTQEDGTRVFMVMIDTPPPGDFGLVDLAKELATSRRKVSTHYVGVTFPMIHFEEKHDLAWIQRLNTENAYISFPAHIKGATQVNRLRMNEVGVRAESTAYATMGQMLSCPPTPYTIDRPFLLWIERDGVPEPLYAAWLDRDAWKDPGGLH